MNSLLDGPYRSMTWWDVAPWIIGAALAFFLLGFHVGINTEARLQQVEQSAGVHQR